MFIGAIELTSKVDNCDSCYVFTHCLCTAKLKWFSRTFLRGTVPNSEHIASIWFFWTENDKTVFLCLKQILQRIILRPW